MNLRINRAPIYISRHGESEYNTLGLIGGDSELSSNGRVYAEALAQFIDEETERENSKDHFSVWCSTLKRTLQTSEPLRKFGFPVTSWRSLCEIEVGICDSMTYAQIEQKYPEEFAARKKDKLCYR